MIPLGIIVDRSAGVLVGGMVAESLARREEERRSTRKNAFKFKVLDALYLKKFCHGQTIDSVTFFLGYFLKDFEFLIPGIFSRSS